PRPVVPVAVPQESVRAKRAMAEPGTSHDAPTVQKVTAGTPVESRPETVLAAPREDQPEELPFDRLGRYRITGHVGRGGVGTVYKGFDEELHRPVAIKVPPRHRITSSGEQDAFLTEAQNLARLDHPGIVPVFDVGRTPDGHCYVVYKLIEGNDLRARM